SCGEKKDKLGCTLLGLMHEKGEITGTPEKAQVEAAYVTACAAGGAIACRTLGKHYLLGRLLDKDPSKAKPLLEKACAAGDASGCTWLAVIYRNGFGVPRDLAKAQALLKTACDDGDKSACKALGSAK
ncbi:MAG: tetratricopeptide repeat protein, partial [Myxococcota bacterium]|nr:tetratricopeptide repeat protein [Myxococcota bacterium]